MAQQVGSTSGTAPTARETEVTPGGASGITEAERPEPADASSLSSADSANGSGTVNIWHNSAIRSVFQAIATPVKSLGRMLRHDKEDGKQASKGAT